MSVWAFSGEVALQSRRPRHRVAPARPPFLLRPSLACWLCGHPHPAAKRRETARAARDPRAAPGPVRVSPAISFSDEKPVALERFAPARRGALGHVGGAGLRTQWRRTPPVVGIPGQGERRAGLSLGQLGRLVWGRDPWRRAAGEWMARDRAP